jgi:serine/threonine protein kinase
MSAVHAIADCSLAGCFAGDAGPIPATAPGPLERDLPSLLFAGPPPGDLGSDSAVPSSTELLAAPASQPDAPSEPATPSRACTPPGPGLGPADGLPVLGSVIDKYRIDAQIGSGGFAVVYKATHLLMRTTVALKLLQPWMLEKRPQLVEQLCEEARFTSLISHPNVVQVFDVTSGPPYTFIVMEYIDGISLGRAIARQPLRPPEVLKLGIHLCAGLAAGLQQGLVHRDIKPANILLSRTGRAKIVDFGLARRTQVGSDAAVPGQAAGEVAGTPAYMAPEQATSPATADFRADIYSLGATLYHASVGVPPFSHQDPLRLVYAHIHRDPPPPEQFIPSFPAELSVLLMAMLAKRPEDRPSSYEDLSARMRLAYEVLAPTRDERKESESGERRLLSRMRSMFGSRKE